jgi:hypothetical protein
LRKLSACPMTRNRTSYRRSTQQADFAYTCFSGPQFNTIQANGGDRGYKQLRPVKIILVVNFL